MVELLHLFAENRLKTSTVLSQRACAELFNSPRQQRVFWRGPSVVRTVSTSDQ